MELARLPLAATGPLRTESLSPLMAGLLAGVLALAAGVLIVVIVMRLTR